jgi:hypothetical protein
VDYTKESTSAEPDPIEFKVRQPETVGVPMMTMAGAIALGAFPMLAGRIKQSVSG